MFRTRPNAVAVLLAAYALLVVSVLAITPLWLDELQQAAPAHAGIADLLRWVQMNPGAVPLPYLMQRALAGLLGNSAFVLRLPAALCGIASGAVFAALCPRFGIRSTFWATALFLALPLQFRYVLEARGYSLGLLCSLLSVWLLLRARETGKPGATAAYGASIALGLYSQPLTILPVLAGLCWLIGERDAIPEAKRRILGAAVAGVLAFLPWYLLQRQTQEQFASMAYYFFSGRQVTLLGILHDLSGGGYACTAVLLLAAVLGLLPAAKLQNRRLAVWIAIAALAGPIVIDRLVNYFFAARQLLFAAPALIWCAAAGVGSMRAWRNYAVLALFLGLAAISDYRLATMPKDAFGAQAGVLAAPLPPGACLAVAPPNQAVYYTFLRPELERKICAEPPDAPAVLAVMSPYSTTADRVQLAEMLEPNYQPADSLRAAPGEIRLYRRRIH